MPATMMHLYAAKVFRPGGSDSYFLGSILPDCLDGYRELKDRVHFRDIPKEDRIPALIAFGKNLNLKRDFDLGVLYHFYLDYLWDYGPQSDHRKEHGEENWFVDYRKDLSRAGNSVSHRFPWAKDLWERLRAPKRELYENSLSLPEKEIREFLEYNYHFHLEECLPEGEFFTDALVDTFICRSAQMFEAFLAEFFPEYGTLSEI